LVLADALYAVAPFFNFLLTHRKHALVVLKQERRDLYVDGLRRSLNRRRNWVPIAVGEVNGGTLPICVPGRRCRSRVRVIRSRETYTVRPQLDQQELLSSEWIWVTTAPPAQLPTAHAVIFGHQRWDIENYAFNQLTHEISVNNCSPLPFVAPVNRRFPLQAAAKIAT
jgi:hypothetical protein